MMYREKGKMWDQIGEYILCSPLVPSDKSGFLNAGRMRASDQYFEHTALPSREEYESWPKHKQDALAEQEWSRRDNGVWFMNNGVPTWIPGQYYFFLNYHRFGDDKPQYRDSHRQLFWVWALFVLVQRNCLGLFLHTRRRWGKTSIAASIGMEAASGIRHFRVGIQSKTDADAKALFLNEIQAPFLALQECPWFLPQTAGTNKPQSELLFDTPTNRKKGAANTPDRLRGLRSRIDFLPSPETAYDSQKLNYFINDEVAKKQDYDPWARHSIVSKQFYPNGPIIGKEFAMTTSDENDDDSVAMAKAFWDNSDPSKLDKRKGLARLFFPDIQGFEVDKFGFDTPQSIQDLNDERLAAEQEGVVAWIRRRRAYPRSIEEAHLESVKTDCLFNQGHISDCQTAIAEYDSQRPSSQALVRRYRLYWADAARTQVAATEDPTGRFLLSWIPPAEWLNQVQQVGTITTKLGVMPRMKPLMAHRFGSGADPFDARTTLKDGSRGGLHAFFGWDTKWEDARLLDPSLYPSHSFFVEYAERPDNPEVFYEDAVLLIHWTGGKLFRETQKDNLGEHIIARGYGDFLARQPVATMSEHVKQTGSERTGAASSVRIIGEYTNAKVIFYQKYVGGPTSQDSVGNPYGPGYNDDGVAYDFRRMPFQRTMAQDIAFNPADANIRKKSDLSVSSGFTLLHMTGLLIQPRKQAQAGGLSLSGVRGLSSIYR